MIRHIFDEKYASFFSLSDIDRQQKENLRLYFNNWSNLQETHPNIAISFIVRNKMHHLIGSPNRTTYPLRSHLVS